MSIYNIRNQLHNLWHIDTVITAMGKIEAGQHVRLGRWVFWHAKTFTGSYYFASTDTGRARKFTMAAYLSCFIKHSRNIN